jgi:hypothetical protein
MFGDAPDAPTRSIFSMIRINSRKARANRSSFHVKT